MKATIKHFINNTYYATIAETFRNYLQEQGYKFEETTNAAHITFVIYYSNSFEFTCIDVAYNIANAERMEG